MKNTYKRIIIVVAIVVCASIGVLYGAQQYTIKKIQSMITAEQAAELEKFLTSLHTDEVPNTEETPKKAEKDILVENDQETEIIETPKLVGNTVDNTNTTTTPSPAQNSNKTVQNQINQVTPSDKEKNTNSEKPSDLNINVKNLDVNALQKQVSLKDQMRGLQLASKLDISYVMSLLSSGITKEEEEELKMYLKQKFTDSEIKEIEAFYYKYSYLLKQ